MPEISTQDQIKRLVELQKIDGEIHNLRIELKEKPALLAQMKDEFEQRKGALKELEEKLKAVQVKRKEGELELKTKEDEIAKGNAQLSQIKTNKEYTAKISEIEHIKADKSIIEERILMSYDEADAVNADIEKEKVNVAEEEKKYLAHKKETEDNIKLMEDRIKVLESQRKQASVGIDPGLLGRYERILQHKNGIAIVPIEGEGACGGCHMNVTPQKVNAIKMHKEIVECEMCSRILYIEDDV